MAQILFPSFQTPDYELPSEGTHAAVCYQTISLGTQDTKFGSYPQIHIGWELDENMSDGRPFVASRRYKMTAHPMSMLRQELESWRGKKFTDRELAEFDIAKLLGRGCLVSIVHSETAARAYANVGKVLPLPRGTPALTPQNACLSLSLSAFDREVFEALPRWLQDTIARSPEYAALHHPTMPNGGLATAVRQKLSAVVEEEPF